MSTELATLPVRDLEVMASRVAKSRLWSMDEHQAFALMLLCQSRGIHPIEAVMRFDIIQGRPAMKADAMLAEFQRIGGTVAWLSDNDNPEYQEANFSHPKLCPKPLRVKFSMKDAARAGLAQKDNWKKNPPNMLRARVVSNALRMVAPGIVSGVYTPEEVSDFEPPATVKVELQKPAEEPAAEPEEVVSFSDGRTRTTNGDAVRDAMGEVEQVTAPAVKDVLLESVSGLNEFWLNHQKSEGVEAPKPLLTVFALEDHLINVLIERGMPATKVQGPSGRYSHPKVLGVLDKCMKRNAEEFLALIQEHGARLMSDEAARLGILDPSDTDGEEVEEAEPAGA